MGQTYQTINDSPGGDTVLSAVQKLVVRDDTLRSNFSGSSNATGGVVGQWQFRTDTTQMSFLKSTGPDVFSRVVEASEISAANIKTLYESNADTNEFSDAEQSKLAALDSALYEKIANKGASNGYAGLDAGGKVPTAQLPDAVLGALQYQGTWNASTNTPTLSSSGGGGSAGHYYVVSVAGSTSIDGISSWAVGDWIVNNGSTWEKVDNTEPIATVFGRTGAVVAVAGDYTATQITNTPAGNIAATTVQAAINELDTEKLANVSEDTSPTLGGDLDGNGNSITNTPYNMVSESGSFTFDAADANAYKVVTNASALNATVPPNSSVAFAVGTVITVEQGGAGQITFVPGSGVTINTAETLKTRTQYAVVSLVKKATDQWVLFGDVEAA